MTVSAFTIRPATGNDVPTLARVAWQSFNEAFAGHPANHPADMEAYMRVAFAVETLETELADPANTYIVAEIEGEIVGYAKLRTGFKEECVSSNAPIELSRLYCLEAHHGKGIGRAMMEECLRIALKKKCDVMWLGVWEYNYRAQAFYAKAGFEKCGTHVFLLGSDPQTDWVMSRSLL